jgi:hypothetical protein
MEPRISYIYARFQPVLARTGCARGERRGGEPLLDACGTDDADPGSFDTIGDDKGNLRFSQAGFISDEGIMTAVKTIEDVADTPNFGMPKALNHAEPETSQIRWPYLMIFCHANPPVVPLRRGWHR